MNNRKYQRWYDNEPTLSLLISLLKNTTIENRCVCAELILKQARAQGITLELNITERVVYELKRWYDKEPLLHEAIEYLRVASEQQRREITREAINYLQVLITA